MKFWLILVTLFIVPFSLAESWDQYKIAEGQCKIAFPKPPNHIKSFSLLNKSENIQTDIYLSHDEGDNIFVLLIANFPRKLSKEEKKSAIEGFIQGFIHNKKSAQVDLLPNDDRSSYFVRIIEKSHQILGRIVMKQNRLYFQATESREEQVVRSFFKSFLRE